MTQVKPGEGTTVAEASDRLHSFLQPGTVAWVGAGIPVTLDYPSWPALVRRLCKECEVDFEWPDQEPPTDTLMDLAEEAQQKDGASFSKFMSEVFGPGRPRPNTRVGLLDLLKLGLPAYITTNFDHEIIDAARRVLPEAEVMHYPDLGVSGLLQESGPSVLCHLHGLADGVNANGVAGLIVLGRTAFESAYVDPGDVADIVSTVLRERSVLFVGVGRGLTEDAYLRSLLEKAANFHERSASRGYTPPRRLALLVRADGLLGAAQSEADRKHARDRELLTDVGIEVVSISARAERPEGAGDWQVDYSVLDRVIEGAVMRRGLLPKLPSAGPYLATEGGTAT